MRHLLWSPGFEGGKKVLRDGYVLRCRRVGKNILSGELEWQEEGGERREVFPLHFMSVKGSWSELGMCLGVFCQER